MRRQLKDQNVLDTEITQKTENDRKFLFVELTLLFLNTDVTQKNRPRDLLR